MQQQGEVFPRGLWVARPSPKAAAAPWRTTEGDKPRAPVLPPFEVHDGASLIVVHDDLPRDPRSTHQGLAPVAGEGSLEAGSTLAFLRKDLGGQVGGHIESTDSVAEIAAVRPQVGRRAPLPFHFRTSVPVRFTITPAEFEAYCFMRLCSIDLDTATKAIAVVGRYRKGDVRAALFRDIAVTYARPFSGNRGVVIPTHRLPISHVPTTARALHEELLNLRNRQFAHSDLDFHNPRVARFGTHPKPWYPMSFKSFDSQALLRRLPDIKRLVEAVERSVQTEIRRYEARF